MYINILFKHDNNLMGTQKSESIIMGFGDSLTWGYYFRGYKKHPYSIQLNKLLKQDNLPFTSTNYGVNGETTDKMSSRITGLFEQEESKRYKIVIIFAGTNDIGSEEPNKILENIKKISEVALNNNIPAIILTLPENKCDIEIDTYTTNREAINKLIREYCENTPNIYLCGLDEELSYLKMKKEDRDLYWDDYLHYTPEGYDILAKIIYKVLKPILME